MSILVRPVELVLQRIIIATVKVATKEKKGCYNIFK